MGLGARKWCLRCDVCESVFILVLSLGCLASLVHVGASCPHEGGLVQVCG